MLQKNNDKDNRIVALAKAFGRHKRRNRNKILSTNFSTNIIKNNIKKIGLFYKLNIFVTIFVSLILFYFIILVSAKPKSFPYITKKIENYLQQNFDKSASIENSFITFTSYGSFKIEARNIKLENSKNINHQFNVPKIEAEIPLYKILFFNLTPNIVKIIDPQIIFNLTKNENSNEDNFTDKNKELYLAPFISFLAAVEQNQLAIKLFEIENLKLIIKNNDQNISEVLLKKSTIKVEARNRSSNKILQISTNNLINFNNKNDINLNANCNFKIKNNTICNLALLNLSTNSISDLSPSLSRLSQINTTLNLTANLSIADSKINKISFKAQAKNGSFELLDFFSQKIDFLSLALQGEYDFSFDNLKLQNIEADIIQNNNNSQNLDTSHLSMSLNIDKLQNTQNNKIDFYIKLSNVNTSEIAKFWPIAIEGQDVRKWAIASLDGGKIDSAFAKFSLATNSAETALEKLESQVIFSGVNLNYDEYFPKINNANGVAKFSENNMEIAVSQAEVLNSKINNATIKIDNFNDDILLLDIASNLTGAASDGLKHANYKSTFANEIEKYFNGNAITNFNIKILLKDVVNLEDIYISAHQKIENFSNQFAKGNIEINLTKNFNDKNFKTAINLDNASLEAKFFDIEKAVSLPSKLEFSLIVVDDNNLQIKNFNLTKIYDIQEKNKTKTVEAKISGDLELRIEPLLVANLNIKNENFGKNNYSFSYKEDEKNKTQNISLAGKMLNLASFLENKSPFENNSDSFEAFILKASIDKVFLVNKKTIDKFSLNIKSNNSLISSGTLKAKYNKQNFVNLEVLPQKDKDGSSVINGVISDVGYLAEGLNISDTISGGNAKIKINNKLENKISTFYANIKIDNDITFYENNTTKKLAKNTLFSKVKDAIFSNNKTTFNNLSIDLNLAQKKLQINSLIANNYKIGITAKGFVNLSNNTYEIKGMIIPGFVVNNLFGIGKIPLIGGVISGLLTGGEGGGLFGIKYQYVKKEKDKEAAFETDKVSAFVPVSIRNLFDSI